MIVQRIALVVILGSVGALLFWYDSAKRRVENAQRKLDYMKSVHTPAEHD